MKPKEFLVNGTCYTIKYLSNGNLILDIINDLDLAIQNSRDKNNGWRAKLKLRNVEFSNAQIKIRETLLGNILCLLWHIKDVPQQLSTLDEPVIPTVMTALSKAIKNQFPVITAPQNETDELLKKVIDGAQLALENRVKELVRAHLLAGNYADKQYQCMIKVALMLTITDKLSTFIDHAITDSVKRHCETLYPEGVLSLAAWQKIDCYNLAPEMTLNDFQAFLQVGYVGTDCHLSFFKMKEAITTFQTEIKKVIYLESVRWPFESITVNTTPTYNPPSLAFSNNLNAISSSAIDRKTIEECMLSVLQDTVRAIPRNANNKQEQIVANDKGYNINYDVRISKSPLLEIISSLTNSIKTSEKRNQEFWRTNAGRDKAFSQSQIKRRKDLLQAFMEYCLFVNDIPPLIDALERHVSANLQQTIAACLDETFPSRPRSQSELDILIDLTVQTNKFYLKHLVEEIIRKRMIFDIENNQAREEIKKIINDCLMTLLGTNLIAIIQNTIDDSIRGYIEKFYLNGTINRVALSKTPCPGLLNEMTLEDFERALSEGKAGTRSHKLLLELKEKLYSFIGTVQGEHFCKEHCWPFKKIDVVKVPANTSLAREPEDHEDNIFAL